MFKKTVLGTVQSKNHIFDYYYGMYDYYLLYVKYGNFLYTKKVGDKEYLETHIGDTVKIRVPRKFAKAGG